MNQLRILIADDHEVVRRGLLLVLNQEPDFTIVGEAENGLSAVTQCRELRPDLVLLDWKMPQLNGLEAARMIKGVQSSIRTLLLSGAPVADEVLDALEQGVDGFVHKDISPADLAHAIRVIAAGKRYLGPEVTQALIARSLQPRQAPSSRSGQHPPLSKRESQVLNLMATPATYREIGEQLFISEETVKTYAKRIFTKLEQPNRTQAVIAGLRLGLIQLQ